MFLPEEVCNRSPDIRADSPQEKTLPSLTVGGPIDCLPQLSRQLGAVKSAPQAILLLFFAYLDAEFLGPDLRQCITHQACIYSSLPEFKSTVDPFPDLPGLVGA